MGNINLDNLFEDQNQKQEHDPDAITDIAIAKPKKKTSEDTSVKGMYAKLKNLMFCIDRSGSTADPFGDPPPEAYKWPDKLADHLKKYVLRINGNREISASDQEFLEMLDESTDEEIKVNLLGIGPEMYGIYRQIAVRDEDTKMGVMKKAVSDLVDRRHEKFPDARTFLMTFHADAMVEAADPATIKMKLQQLYPAGGTNIRNAVDKALDYFAKYPSPVGLNHLVLVTDGEDWGAISVADLLDQMIEQNVQLDYIYIKKKVPGMADGNPTEVAKCFKSLCEKLGGEYVEVNNPAEFEKKLIQASERLMLPAGV